MELLQYGFLRVMCSSENNVKFSLKKNKLSLKIFNKLIFNDDSMIYNTVTG